MTGIYGGELGEVHPDRNSVVVAALERFDNNAATNEDLFVLWADVALNAAWVEAARELACYNEAASQAARAIAVAKRLAEEVVGLKVELSRQAMKCSHTCGLCLEG